MSWRRLEDVFRLQKTSSRRLDQDEHIHLSHTFSEDDFKTSSRRLGQDQYIRLGHTSSRHLQDVFKTSSRRFEEVFKTPSRRLAKILQESSKRLQDLPAKISSRRFQDVSSNQNVLFNKSLRCTQHVCKTYCKHGYLQKDLPRSHFWEIYGQCTKFAKVIKISQVLVFYFTTPFSGCLQRRI